MQEFQTGAVRDTGGKGRMDLLPMCALLRISKHMEDAIIPDPITHKPHYPERNWENGIPMHSMIDSALRHLAKYVDGQNDEDHLCAAATNLLMAMWTEEKLPEMQDIPSRASPLVRTTREGEANTRVPTNNKEQEEPTGRCRTACVTFYRGRCLSAGDTPQVSCGGDRNKCDFYGG